MILAGFTGPFRAHYDEQNPIPTAYCGDECMQLSLDQQRDRAVLADLVTAGKSVVGMPNLRIEDLGTRGTSWFAKELPYVCPANFFLVPFAHALLYGVVADFWRCLLPSTTGQLITAVMLMCVMQAVHTDGYMYMHTNSIELARRF